MNAARARAMTAYVRDLVASVCAISTRDAKKKEEGDREGKKRVALAVLHCSSDHHHSDAYDRHRRQRNERKRKNEDDDERGEEEKKLVRC